MRKMLTQALWGWTEALTGILQSSCMEFLVNYDFPTLIFHLFMLIIVFFLLPTALVDRF